jgi:hypothetical protein
MDDQLHPARGVEEALDDDPLLRRQRAEDGERARQVVDDLARTFVVEADRGDQFSDRCLAANARDPGADLVAQARDRERQLVAPARRFAEPERDARRGAVRVLDPDPAGLDAQDAVARVAELEDVAGDALDREVLVDGTDVRALRLEDDGRSRRCRESFRPGSTRPGASPSSRAGRDGRRRDGDTSRARHGAS